MNSNDPLLTNQSRDINKKRKERNGLDDKPSNTYKFEETELHALKKLKNIQNLNSYQSIQKTVFKEEVNNNEELDVSIDADEDMGRLYGSGLDKHDEYILDIIDDKLDSTYNKSKNVSDTTDIRNVSLPKASSGKFEVLSDEEEEGENGTKDHSIHNKNDEKVNKVNKYISNLKKCINKNTLMRSKFLNNPSKFMDSELDLNSSINELLNLSIDVEYIETLFLNSVKDDDKDIIQDVFVTLFFHENIDIVNSTVKIFKDFTFKLENESLDDKYNLIYKKITKTLIKFGIINILYQVLDRIDLEEKLSVTEDKEDKDIKQEIVFNILSIIKNLISNDPSISNEIILDNNVRKWILDKLSIKQEDYVINALQQDIIEILSNVIEEDSYDEEYKFKESVILKDLVQHEFLNKIINFLTLYCYKQMVNKIEYDETFKELISIYEIVCLNYGYKESIIGLKGIELIKDILSVNNEFYRINCIKSLYNLLSKGNKSIDYCNYINQKEKEMKLIKTIKKLISKKKFNKLLKNKNQLDYNFNKDLEYIFGIINDLFKNTIDLNYRKYLINLFLFNIDGYDHDNQEVVDINNNETLDYILKIHDKFYNRLYKEEDEPGNIEEEEEYIDKMNEGLISLININIFLIFVNYEDRSKAFYKLLTYKRVKQIKFVINNYLYYYDIINNENNADWILGNEKDIIKSLLNVLNDDHDNDN